MAPFGPLVSPAWLAEHVEDDDVRVVDVRYYADGRPGRAAYEAGHIPGAAFVDLDTELSSHAPGAGRHPLPDRETFEVAMRRAGIGGGTRVVAYDDQAGFTAGRLWWLLRYFGHDAVAVLDGGLQAWPGRLATGTEVPPPGDLTASGPRDEMRVTLDEVRDRPAGAVLLDARAPERYRGEVEPLDPRPGHIPGARSAWYRENLEVDGRFRPPEALRRRYEELGARPDVPVVVYCGSGVSACLDLLAMEVAGIGGARLYAGSWSEWSSRPDTPAALGE